MTPDSGSSSRPAALALLLPGYSPDLQWVARALLSGHVILDDEHPFSRKSRVHRTKIRTPDGHQWLTIPVVTEDRRKPVNKVRIDHDRPWLRHHRQALEFNYRNSLYFDYYEPEIRADLEAASECEMLLDAVRHMMERQLTYLACSFSYDWMSELKSFRQESAETDSPYGISDRIVTGYAGFHHSVVWQEPRSRTYQKPHPDAAGTEFRIPEYRQHFPGFVPGCGILDVIFEYGPDAWMILDTLGISEP